MGYEKMLADASAKRATDAKSQAEKEKLGDTKLDAMANAEYISSLHSECDWLLQYYEARKSARAGESESLVNAKAVLSGADFALVQTAAAHRSGFMAPRAQ